MRHRNQVPATVDVDAQAEATFIAERDYPHSTWPDPPAASANAQRASETHQAIEGVDPVLYPGGLPNLNLTPEQATQIRVRNALEALTKSGPASSELSTPARKTIEGWKTVAGPEVAFEDFRCFKNGCTATSRHKDAASAQLAGDEITRAASFLTWPGPKFRSGPLTTSSGQAQLVWILYRSRLTPTNDHKESP